MSKSAKDIAIQDKWWADAKEYAEKIGYAVYEKELFIEVYYADGYSPEEAVREDWSYLQ